MSLNDQRVSRYAARVLATKREAEIRMDRSDFGARKETHKRKELAEAGCSPAEIDRYMDEMKRRKLVGFIFERFLNSILNNKI